MEISAYAFKSMFQNNDHQVITLQLKDLEELEAQNNRKSKIDSDKVPKLISNITVIRLEDYNKFLIKIQKKSYTKNQLKQIVLSKYHDYLNN